MADGRLSKADRQRLVRSLTAHLGELPRQVVALETAMQEFGQRFELARFKRAFNSSHEPRLYNRVQAVERAFGRVQNFLAEMAVCGARLAELPVNAPRKGDTAAKPSFDALREAGIIDADLCRRLENGQRARSRLEHDYLYMPAGDVHRAVENCLKAAEGFVGPFTAWIEPFLE